MTMEAEEQRRQQAIDYVTQIVWKFQRECESAAKNRGTSHEFVHVVPEKWDRDRNMLQQLIREHLNQMGFDSCKVSVGKVWGNGSDECRLCLSASWERAAPEKEPAADRAGSTGTCPVCHEDRPVVALMPCGHVVCKQCQGQLRQCPMCRIQLTGATRALFLS